MSITVGARPSCPNCHQPFEPRDDSRVPYALPCGHICCIGCLSHQPTSCPLCGTTCRAPSCVRIVKPTSSTFRGGNTGPSDTDISRQLLESISQVDEHTPLISLHRLYQTANDFLKRQSRNRCKDLEVNVKLLRTLVLTKEALVAQSLFVDDLAERIESIGSENVDLQSRLDEAEYRGVRDIPYNISDHAEVNSVAISRQFNSLTNHMASFRAELDDLRASIQGLQNQGISSSNLDSVSPIPSLSSGASDSLSPLQTPSHAWVTSQAHELDDDRFFIPPLPDIASRGDDGATLSSVPQTPIIHPVRLPEHSHQSFNFDEYHGHRMGKGFFHDQNLVERELKGRNASPSEMLSWTKNEAIDSEGVLSPLSCISSLRLHSEPSLPAEHPGDGLNTYPNKLDYSQPDVQTWVHVQNTDSEVASDIDEERNDDDDDDVDPMSLSTSSISLLKTPQYLSRPSAAHMQMRLRELLRDGVQSHSGGVMGDDLSRISARGLTLNKAEGAPGAMVMPATMPTGCAPVQQGNFTTSTDADATSSVPTHLMVSEHRSTSSAMSNLTFRPPSGGALPLPPPPPPPPGLVSRSRSRIPIFALNKGLHELAGRGSTFQGVTIDPGALAQHFLHEMEGCLIIEAVARVFMQLLAGVRGGGFVNQQVDLLTEGAEDDNDVRVGELIDLTDELEEEGEGG